MQNQKCSSGNLVCIEHFQMDDYAVKGQKYCLKKFAIPTIFPEATNLITKPTNTIEVCRESQSAVNFPCTECLCKENEIQFLRKCLAGFDLEREKLQKQLDMKTLQIQKQSQLIQNLSEELERFKTNNTSDLVRFALDGNPEVSLIRISIHEEPCNETIFIFLIIDSTSKRDSILLSSRCWTSTALFANCSEFFNWTSKYFTRCISVRS